jgi:hypothetical protein
MALISTGTTKASLAGTEKIPIDELSKVTTPDQLKEYIDVISPVSIADTTVLDTSAFGKLHICTGTSADYTVTLPATSGNSGKSIGFKGDFALTRTVTLDGNSAETIDGWLTKKLTSTRIIMLTVNAAGTAWSVTNHNNGRILLYQNSVTSAGHTGDTAEFLVDSFQIPANTIKPNDRIVITAEWAKVGTAGAWNLKHRFHTSAAVGGTSLMAPNPGGTIISPSTQRTIVCKNSQSSQEILTTTANVLLDLGTSQNSIKNTLSVDFTVAQFLNSTVQMGNSADTGFLSAISVEIIRD